MPLAVPILGALAPQAPGAGGRFSASGGREQKFFGGRVKESNMLFRTHGQPRPRSSLKQPRVKRVAVRVEAAARITAAVGDVLLADLHLVVGVLRPAVRVYCAARRLGWVDQPLH